MIWFMAVTDDAYELPVYIARTQLELSQKLGMSNGTVGRNLLLARSGVVRCNGKRRGIKYFRMDHATGEVLRGKTRDLKAIAKKNMREIEMEEVREL